MKPVALFTALVALSACEETGSRPLDLPGRDAGPSADDGGPREDGSEPPGPESLRYTPAGCDYEVVTPEVREARVGGTVLGPSPALGYVHASFVGPTDSSFAVNWRTDSVTTWSQLLVGTDQAAVEAAEGAADGVMVVEGHQILFRPIVGPEIRLHEAHACGLSPSTQYFYKVGGPGRWSPVYDVATGPPVGSDEPFRFAVAGDSRNDSVIWAETQDAIQRRSPDFQLFSGDAVVLGPNQPEWDGFFGQVLPSGFDVVDALARIPLMPANGNHDGLSINYVLQFAVPQQESAGELAQGEQWYSFDYGNAHFVVLDDSAGARTNEGPQRAFLQADLASVDRGRTPWVFVMHHQPAYSCSTARGSDLPIRNAWQPLFDLYQVDMVWNGHNHNYERSLPIRGFREGTNEGTIADTGPNGVPVRQSGTVYIVAAGAGAPLYGVNDTCYFTHVAESTRNYVIVEIEGRTLRYTAYRLDGTVLDEVTFSK